jgi:predicted transcriptional regulator of viral defense system
MDHLGLTYYASLLTALAYHDRQLRPAQTFYVMTKKNRPALTCGRVRVEFVARTNADLIPTVRIETPRGHIRVSTLEATAFDLIGYCRHAGGLEAVAEVLSVPTDLLASELLPAVASRSPVPWAQRLGYIISQVATPEMVAPLAAYVRRHARATVALDPDHPTAGAPRDREWRVYVNRRIVLYP